MKRFILGRIGVCWGHNAWEMGWYLQTLAAPSVMTSEMIKDPWPYGIPSLSMVSPCFSKCFHIRSAILFSASAFGTPNPEVRAQSRFGHHWWDPFAWTGAPVWSISGWCFSGCFFLCVFSFFGFLLFSSQYWYHDTHTIVYDTVFIYI